MVLFESMAGVRLTPVHYRGGAPVLTDLLGDEEKVVHYVLWLPAETRAQLGVLRRGDIRVAEQFEGANKNQSETARRLGVSRPALIEKLHKYGLIGR